MIFSIIRLIEFSSESKYPEILESYNVHQSTFLSPNESIALNIHNRSTHFIYIDIGCFNGETVEFFIHFNPNSTLYDIITFEPDPVNYKLCKQKLSQPKYKNYNIIIIPKAVWIHNGKVSYHIGRGKKSRIYQSKTSKEVLLYKQKRISFFSCSLEDTSDLAKLDAIDFSSWLSQLPKSKDTKIHIKISMLGTETRVLRKMVVDDTLSLADKWDIEWSDRSNPRTYPQRIYLQIMLDSSGFMCTGFTRLNDVRKVFKMNGTHADITKYIDLRKLPDMDTYSHYTQRPIFIDPPRILNPRVNSNKL